VVNEAMLKQDAGTGLASLEASQILRQLGL
jgi:hypothetical protein